MATAEREDKKKTHGKRCFMRRVLPAISHRAGWRERERIRFPVRAVFILRDVPSVRTVIAESSARYCAGDQGWMGCLFLFPVGPSIFRGDLRRDRAAVSLIVKSSLHGCTVRYEKFC